MGVAISSTLLGRLLSAAQESQGAEICGLLFGSSSHIHAAEDCANVSGHPARTFEIDPVALFAAHRAARRGGPNIIGCYHSHPSGEAVPSACDARAAMGDGALWLILAGGEARLWRTERLGEFDEAAMVMDHSL